MSDRARSRPVPRGRARRLLVGARRRGGRPDPPCRPRGHRGRQDGRAGPLGRRVPGLGRARRLSRDRPRASGRAGCSGCRPRCCATGPTPGSRSAAISSRGCTAPRARSSRPRGSASPWSRWAPSRPGWRTRSTTRRPPPPARSTASTPPARRCSRRCGGSPATRSRPGSSPPSTRCAARSNPESVDLDPLDRADREQALSAWLDRPRRRAGVDHRTRAGRRRGRSRLVRAGCRRCSRDQRLRARPGVGGEHALGDHAAVRGEGVDAADLRARRRRQVVLADGPGVDAADRRDRRPRQHAGDARAQAPRRRRRWSATTAPTSRGSRRTPASSTRCGPT